MKLTKRSYEARIAHLIALRIQLEYVRDNMITACSDDPLSSMGAALNHIHDAISDMEQEIRDTQSAWEHRNWTRQDYRSYELVAANID